MKMPGFTADESLFRSARHYSTGSYKAHAAGLSPQLESECCDITCPGECICFHGHGQCAHARRG